MPEVNKTVAEVIYLMREQVEKYKEQAGQRGWHSESPEYDTLKMQLAYYEMGRNGTIPPEWAQYLIQTTPDYQEYLRLKRKFEGG